jgi:tRNA-uridine 2-sulfurtransferase
MTTKHRIVVGLSGGVDSSVAAWLLKKAGHEVVGIFMKNWEDDDTDQYCSSRQDLIDAASVADVVGIELEAVNFAAEYRDRVFASFLREYAAGRTPNPDVLCNSEIKFRSFLDHARAQGADRIATGHYARLSHGAGGVELLRATDTSKDQTYFLHQLAQEQLASAMFPVGEMTKRQVRALAREHGIPTYAKKDSTGICFIGERPFREFLARYLPKQSGQMRTPEGVVVGHHQGLAYYTLGQRQGLGIGGTHGGSSEPWFVAGKDRENNTLLVVQGHGDRRLYSRIVETGPMHWIAGTPPRTSRLAAKTRYRMPDASCILEAVESMAGSDSPDRRWRALFDAPQWAPTSGQYLVIYDGDVCLGGAVIESARDESAVSVARRMPSVAA